MAGKVDHEHERWKHGHRRKPRQNLRQEVASRQVAKIIFLILFLDHTDGVAAGYLPIYLRLERLFPGYEYFFPVHSGTKLPTSITRKASQKKIQSNEMTETKFNTPAIARAGKKIPSILQWTLPQDRPFIKQPIPAHATAVTQKTPAAVRDRREALWALMAPTARTAGTPHSR